MTTYEVVVVADSLTLTIVATWADADKARAMVARMDSFIVGFEFLDDQEEFEAMKGSEGRWRELPRFYKRSLAQ